MNFIKQIVCIFKGHDFTSWRESITPGGQVPWATCDRCGGEA